MKKISLKNLDSLGIEKMSKNDLKKVIGGSSELCGVQAGGALCPDGQCCSSYGYCGTGEAYCGPGCQSQCGDDPNPKITACKGKVEFDTCSWKNSAGYPYTGKCRYRFASPLYCSDTIFV